MMHGPSGESADSASKTTHTELYVGHEFLQRLFPASHSNSLLLGRRPRTQGVFCTDSETKERMHRNCGVVAEHLTPVCKETCVNKATSRLFGLHSAFGNPDETVFLPIRVCASFLIATPRRRPSSVQFIADRSNTTTKNQCSSSWCTII